MYDYDVVLGCFGLRQDGFISCGSVQNIILKVGPATHRYDEMTAYFEQCRLFDKPMFELNGIRHFIFNMQNRYDQVMRPIWTQKQFDLYQKFIMDHRFCGLFLRLSLPVEDSGKTSKDVSEIEIPVKHQAHNLPKNGLRLVSGK
jgi:hypothetical protein